MDHVRHRRGEHRRRLPAAAGDRPGRRRAHLGRDGADRPRAGHAMNLAAIVRDLERFEGRYPHLYRDCRGYVTIGVGNLVSTADACARLPLLRPGSPPTPALDDEKRVAWNAVNAAKPNMRASYYRPLSALRLS